MCSTCRAKSVTPTMHRAKSRITKCESVLETRPKRTFAKALRGWEKYCELFNAKTQKSRTNFQVVGVKVTRLSLHFCILHSSFFIHPEPPYVGSYIELTGWPGHLSSAEDVTMQVGHGFARAGAVVENQSKAGLLESQFVGDLRRLQQKMTEDLLVFRFCLRDPQNRLLRNNQNVCRRLRFKDRKSV